MQRNFKSQKQKFLEQNFNPGNLSENFKAKISRGKIFGASAERKFPTIKNLDEYSQKHFRPYGNSDGLFHPMLIFGIRDKVTYLDINQMIFSMNIY